MTPTDYAYGIGLGCALGALGNFALVMASACRRAWRGRA